MNSTTVAPVAALSATVAGLIGIVYFDPSYLLMQSVVLLIVYLITTRHLAGIWTVTKFTAPFLFPVYLVHGVLNASFPKTQTLFEFIPLRHDGLAYASAISVQFVTIAVIGLFWMATTRECLVNFLVAVRAPLWVILFAVQAMSIAGSVERRIGRIYLAQRARGIPVSAGFLSRIRAFPSVLIPAVVATLSEAHERAEVLVSRGFTSLTPTTVTPALTVWSATQVLLTVISIVVPLGVRSFYA